MSFAPGEAYQFDWSHETITLAGLPLTVKAAHMKLSHSRMRRQRQFFEFAGPLFSVTVSPASTMVRVGEANELRALPRDRARRRVEHDLTFQWQIVEGPGALAGMHDQAVTFLAPDDPGLTRVMVTVRQRDVVCAGEGLITVTHELMGQLGAATVSSQGLPGYTFERAPGGSWRSRRDAERNVIVINNGHRDLSMPRAASR